VKWRTLNQRPYGAWGIYKEIAMEMFVAWLSGVLAGFAVALFFTSKEDRSE
jgi:hypothetical protein